VPDNPVTLGRGENCTFVMDDEEVAVRHAVVEHTVDGMYIRDLGTMSHILVNNREIGESRLKHGDVVELGRTQFLVQVSVQAEVNGVGAAPPRRRTSPAFAVLFFLICAGAAGVLCYHYWPEKRGEYLGPELTAIKADDVPQNLPPVPESGGDGRAVTPTPEPAGSPTSSEVPPSSAAGSDVTDVGNTPAEVQREPETAVEAEPARVAPPPPETVEADAPDTQPPPPPEPPPPAPEPARPPKPVASRKLVGVDSVQQSRFPQAEDFAEMRLVKVKLVPRVPVDTIDVSDIRVEVEFFDRDARSGSVERSKAIVICGPLEPEGAWLPEQSRTLEATYVVPKSWPGAGRRSGRYYGHVVRLYYGDDLQEIYARPLDLADVPAP